MTLRSGPLSNDGMSQATDQENTMKAIVQDTYGPPEVLELRDIDKPVVKDNEVLIRVHAAAVNAADWHLMRGLPLIGRMAFGLRKPKIKVRGRDVAGTVEAVGRNVTQFQPGDEVYAEVDTGSFAEYTCVSEEVLGLKPANLTFEQAAAVPVSATTALQGLRDQGRIQAGQKVLINGASGGVGTFAVQIAKTLGAEVTGVCSTRNVDLVRSLGADHVIDYTREDFTRSDRRYDLMLDVAGSRSWSECRRVLEPQATLVVVGAQRGSRLLGPLSHIAKVRLAALRSSRKVVFFIAKLNKPDLAVLRELLEAGKVTPAIDRRYELSESADALRYLGEGHARAKIVISV
jgi:NADPH:quinone reductase-like Zn-dependent oxidoreductase